GIRQRRTSPAKQFFQRCVLNFTAVLFIVLFFSGMIMGNQLELQSLIPEGAKDFKKVDQAQLFDRKNLFDYMDGGAELYLSYDFQRLSVQEYRDKDRVITVEVYEMKTSQDAFGLFSLDQEGENLAIGDKANYGSGLLKFWKGNHFVRIVDLNGNDQFKDEILELGKKISSQIDKKGELPLLLSKLPVEGLIHNSERFFHKQIVLNNLYFLSTENLLNLNEKTSAVMGDYLWGKMNLKLLLISYPDTSSARSAFERFCTKYLKSSPSGKKVIQKVEEDKFIGLELEKNYLWITFEGKDERNTGDVLRNVKEKLK
ncbi:MAG: hypothetical protein Q8N71_01800, partial [candidate division Zixibacteria bacterium]|nr:hypothetical protein [candidate division Zixibacteria bacterium]